MAPLLDLSKLDPQTRAAIEAAQKAKADAEAETGKTWRNRLASGIRVAGPFLGAGVGAALGSETGPGAIATGIVGRTLGSTAAEYIAEKLEGAKSWTDASAPVRPGQVLTEGVLGGLIPKGPIQGAVQGYTGQVARRAAEEGKTPLQAANPLDFSLNDWGNVGISTGFGAIGAKFHAPEKGPSVPTPPERTPEGRDAAIAKGRSGLKISPSEHLALSDQIYGPDGKGGGEGTKGPTAQKIGIDPNKVVDDPVSINAAFETAKKMQETKAKLQDKIRNQGWVQESRNLNAADKFKRNVEVARDQADTQQGKMDTAASKETEKGWVQEAKNETKREQALKNMSPEDQYKAGLAPELQKVADDTDAETAAILAQREKDAAQEGKNLNAKDKYAESEAKTLDKAEIDKAARIKIEKAKEGKVPTEPSVSETVSAPNENGVGRQSLSRRFVEPKPPEKGEGDGGSGGDGSGDSGDNGPTDAELPLNSAPTPTKRAALPAAKQAKLSAGGRPIFTRQPKEVNASRITPEVRAHLEDMQGELEQDPLMDVPPDQAAKAPMLNKRHPITKSINANYAPLANARATTVNASNKQVRHAIQQVLDSGDIHSHVADGAVGFAEQRVKDAAELGDRLVDFNPDELEGRSPAEGQDSGSKITDATPEPPVIEPRKTFVAPEEGATARQDAIKFTPPKPKTPPVVEQKAEAPKEPPVVDTLPTGEGQPRLPGAEGVREAEAKTPQVGKVSFPTAPIPNTTGKGELPTPQSLLDSMIADREASGQAPNPALADIKARQEGAAKFDPIAGKTVPVDEAPVAPRNPTREQAADYDQKLRIYNINKKATEKSQAKTQASEAKTFRETQGPEAALAASPSFSKLEQGVSKGEASQVAPEAPEGLSETNLGPNSGAVPVKVFKSPLEAAGSNYGEVKDAIKAAKAGQGPPVPEEGRAAAGRAAQRENAASRLKGQSGEIDPMLMMRLAGGGLGAATGAYEDPDHPVEGILGGALLGSLAPSVGRAGVNAATSRGASIPADLDKAIAALSSYQRGALLLSKNLPANVAAPWGSGIMSSLEKTAQLDPRGPRALKELLNPYSFLSHVPEAWHNANKYIGDAERAEQLIGEAPTLGQKAMSLPGTAMTTADDLVRMALKRANFTEEEARRATLTNSPDWKISQSLQKIGRSDDGSPNLFSMLLPFKRTASNIMESGVDRMPGFGFLSNMKKDVPDSIKNSAIKQGIGGTVFYGSKKLGEYVDPENAPMVGKFLSNLTGQYGMEAMMGFTAGQAEQMGKNSHNTAFQDVVGDPTALAKGFMQHMPMPTTKPIDQGLRAAGGFLSGEIPFPKEETPLTQRVPGNLVPGLLHKPDTNDDWENFLDDLIKQQQQQQNPEEQQ